MTGAEQAVLALRLEQALAAAGLQIVRGDVERGNLVGWQPVSAVAILGRLATFGWRVEELPAYNGPRVLTLERPS
jgi:hypothetical protein